MDDLAQLWAGVIAAGEVPSPLSARCALPGAPCIHLTHALHVSLLHGP